MKMIDSEANAFGNQTVLYEYISRKLSSGGITKEEFEKIKTYPIGHNSVEGFVSLNIAVGNLDWRGDTLVNADRRFTLKLTREEECDLNARAYHAGLSPTEFVYQILSEALSQK